MLSHIDLILLVVGGRPDKLLPAVDHFTAASSLPVQIHVVTDVPFVPGDYPISYRTHSLEESKLPEAALRMHRKFAKVTHGPGNIYMWKPLLHLLPSLSLVERAIVLDLDVFIPRGRTLRRCIANLTPFHRAPSSGSPRSSNRPTTTIHTLRAAKAAMAVCSCYI